MRRRRFIALAVSVGSAGCGGSSDPQSPSPTDTPDGPTSTSRGTPTATATPSPTEEPMFIPSETPTEAAPLTITPVSEPAPIDVEGSGLGITGRFEVRGGFTSFAMVHDGSSDFRVQLIDAASGETQAVIADGTGTWAGRRATHVPPGEYVIKVTADGSWSIQVTQPRPTTADVLGLPQTFDGDATDYRGPLYFTGNVRVNGQHAGAGDFVVWALQLDGQRVARLFDEAGAFDGSTTFSHEGVGWLQVEADGEWSLDVRRA